MDVILSKSPQAQHILNAPIPRQTPMALFYWHEIAQELESLLKDLPDTATTDPTDGIAEEFWAEWMESLVACFGSLPPHPGPGAGSLLHAVLGADPLFVDALAARIRLALASIKSLTLSNRVHFAEELVFLLPVSFADRLRMLVGAGVLPAVKVTQYDLAFRDC